jgi:hypothetical protein
MSRFLDDKATGTNGVTLIVNGIEANGPGVTPSAIQACICVLESVPSRET